MLTCTVVNRPFQGIEVLESAANIFSKLRI